MFASNDAPCARLRARTPPRLSRSSRRRVFETAPSPSSARNAAHTGPPTRALDGESDGTRSARARRAQIRSRRRHAMRMQTWPTSAREHSQTLFAPTLRRATSHRRRNAKRDAKRVGACARTTDDGTDDEAIETLRCDAIRWRALRKHVHHAQRARRVERAGDRILRYVRRQWAMRASRAPPDRGLTTRTTFATRSV